MRGLTDRRAVVTGGGAGIGRAAAERLAAEGAAVAVLDLDVDAAERVAEQLRAGGADAHAFAADVADPDGLHTAIESAAAALGGIDALVTSAGVAVPGGAADLSVDDWERVVGVNLRGIFLSMKYAVPHLRAAAADGRTSAIVNVTSIHAHLGFAGWAGYASTKGGVVSLTQQAAVEFAPEAIRVNSVAPGTIMTPLNEKILAEAADPDEVLRTWNSLHALGRFGDPSEVGGAIAYLLSADASFVTGVCLPVDGGATVLGANTRSS